MKREYDLLRHKYYYFFVKLYSVPIVDVRERSLWPCAVGVKWKALLAPELLIQIILGDPGILTAVMHVDLKYCKTTDLILHQQ
jgi:hypothetical protein